MVLKVPPKTLPAITLPEVLKVPPKTLPMILATLAPRFMYVFKLAICFSYYPAL